ncbi:hypothetical protein EAW52_10665 [Pseudomonas sp. LTJR-52]|uniref:hypothetical protein n=1 Tax=Pseudomonas sp. LTJR-52 TaxID=2479392 RepID=UPI000EFD3E90|nr:hypothetical protein [Pseudomonas sp. LTJR-52]AYN94389.1 hypothetical protein EAW52_10665 [Pseudomonas sp. LTJR-52]
MTLAIKHRTPEAISAAVSRQAIFLSMDMDDEYFEGRAARDCSLTEKACPYGRTQMRKRCAWFAGYYDA